MTLVGGRQRRQRSRARSSATISSRHATTRSRRSAGTTPSRAVTPSSAATATTSSSSTSADSRRWSRRRPDRATRAIGPYDGGTGYDSLEANFVANRPDASAIELRGHRRHASLELPVTCRSRGTTPSVGHRAVRRRAADLGAHTWNSAAYSGDTRRHGSASTPTCSSPGPDEDFVDSRAGTTSSPAARVSTTSRCRARRRLAQLPGRRGGPGDLRRRQRHRGLPTPSTC